MKKCNIYVNNVLFRYACLFHWVSLTLGVVVRKSFCCQSNCKLVFFFTFLKPTVMKRMFSKCSLKLFYTVFKMPCLRDSTCIIQDDAELSWWWGVEIAFIWVIFPIFWTLYNAIYTPSCCDPTIFQNFHFTLKALV